MSLLGFTLLMLKSLSLPHFCVVVVLSHVCGQKTTKGLSEGEGKSVKIRVGLFLPQKASKARDDFEGLTVKVRGGWFQRANIAG